MVEILGNTEVEKIKKKHIYFYNPMFITVQS